MIIINLANVTTEQGNWFIATKISFSRETGDKSIAAYATYGLCHVQTLAGDLPTAKKQCLDALRTRQEMGDKATIAETRSRYAELLIEEGQPQEAETLLRQALEEFVAERLSDDEIEGRAILAYALTAQGRTAGAQSEINSAQKLVTKSQNAVTRIRLQIIAARQRARTGTIVEAKDRLETVLNDAIKYGFVGYELEAKLALGELEMNSGKMAAGRCTSLLCKKRLWRVVSFPFPGKQPLLLNKHTVKPLRHRRYSCSAVALRTPAGPAADRGRPDHRWLPEPCHSNQRDAFD